MEILQKDKEILQKDKEILNKEREKNNLPAPVNFDKSRITPEHITKLLPLLQLPFEENAIVRRERDDFVSKGVPLSMQLMRVFEVFGADHIRFEHDVVEKDIVKREGKSDMHYYKVYVKLSIGNWTIYNEDNCKPSSTFVSYYEVEGIGYGGHTSLGTAEKNAVANGKKECLKNMGVLAYLYVEGEYSGEGNSDIDDVGVITPAHTYPVTKIVLKDKPIINENAVIFLKGRALDSSTNSEIEIIIYKENPQMKEEHQKMIDNLKQYKSLLVAGRELQVEYMEGNVARPQYIIRKLIFTNKK
ncbi:hypothetical protein [Clostridium magnum]|nr:hypothetical protein [Clostridium magnum]